MCLTEPGAPALVLSAGQLLEEPSRRVVWETSRGAPTGLDCAPGVAVVSVAGETRGRLVWLGQSESGWRIVAETELKGVPGSLRLIRGRAAALLATKRDVRLVVQDGPDARPVQRELVSPPSCLTAMPGEDLLLVGAGSRIMTFRAASAGTWLVYDFDEEITACEARSGARGLLVAHGSRLVLVDPADPARRGRLPVRAEARFDGPITEFAWTGAGEVAAVRLAAPDRIVYVRGSDLEALGAIALRDARPGIEPLAAGWVLWSTGSGTLAEHRLDETALAEARPLGPLPRPAPERAVEGEEGTADAAAEKTEDVERAAPSAGRPHAVVRRLPPEQPVEVRLPEVESPPSEAASAEAVEPARADSSPPPEPLAEPETAAVALPDAPAEPAVTVPAAAPSVESRPAPDREPESESQPVPPTPPAIEPAARDERAAEVDPPPGSESPDKQTVIEPLPRAMPGGAIAGEITGEVDLVEEIVILGPDSVLSEYRRIAPERLDGRAVFRLGGVPAGSYRVLPMGRDGASLLVRPAFRTVEVSAETGGRADFEIVRALP